MSLFLTREEVAELTGAHKKARQIAVLIRNGIRHTINAAGWPMVTRVAVEGGQSAALPPPRWQSNKAA